MSRFSSANHSARAKPRCGREDDHRAVAGRQIRGDRLELGPRLERALLPAPRRRVVDAALGRVDVDHAPTHCSLEHLTQRLGGVEPVARRERDPPGGDLLRSQLADWSLAEHGDRLPEQPTQLLDRHSVDVMLREIRLHQFADRQGARDSPLALQTFQLPLQSLGRVTFRRKSASLYSLRAPTAHSVTERPERLPAPTPALQLDQLTLLRHRDHPFSRRNSVIVIRASVQPARRPLVSAGTERGLIAP
jgi:hypothetical protein